MEAPEVDPMLVKVMAARWDRLPDKMVRQLLVQLSQLDAETVQTFAQPSDRNHLLYWALDIAGQSPLPIACITPATARDAFCLFGFACKTTLYGSIVPPSSAEATVQKIDSSGISQCLHHRGMSS